MYSSAKALILTSFLLALLTFFAMRYLMTVDSFDRAEPEEVGLSSQKLQNLIGDIKKGKYQQIHSLLVFKHDRLVVEEYFSGNDDFIEFENDVKRNSSRPQKDWQADDLHYVASINKAVTSMLTGIVLRNYTIDIDAKIHTFLPSKYQTYFTSEPLKALSFRHLLDMELGVEWDEWEGDDLKRMWKQDDFIPYLTSKEAYGPDIAWVYNSASSNLLLTLLDNITGDIRTYAQQNFYAKLGIQAADYKWEDQPTGVPEGAARLYLRSQDMMKIGVMLLSGGIWQDQRVLPSEWLDIIYSETAKHNGEYSLGFWRYEIAGHSYLSANGDGGQYINVFAEDGIVVVMTQGNYLEHPLYFEQAEEMMRRYLFD